MPPKSIGQKLLETLDEAVSKADVERLFKQLIDFIKTTKTTLESLVASHKEEVQKELENLAKSQTEANKEVSGRVDNMKELLYSESRTLIRLFRDEVKRLEMEMPEMPDMTPMHQRHEEMEKKLAEVEAKIPTLPEEKDYQSMIEEMREYFEQELKKLRELLTQARGTVGGGVTNMRIAQAFKYILKTETVQGTIDGANTTFTVSQPIFAILSLSINGEVIAQLPNYTINGKIIEFSSAIPAAYAGKDFEAKYV